MSESGRESDEYTYSDDDSSANSEFTDNLHSSDDDGVSETESEDISEQNAVVRHRRTIEHSDSEFECEEVIAVKRAKVKDEPQNYAPDRWPPIIDFIFVFSSFLAAAVAAYFTIF